MTFESASTKGNSAQGVRPSVAPSSAQIGAPQSPAWISPPKWLIDAWTPANEWLDDEEWNDALIQFWGACLAAGATAVTRDTRLYPADGTYTGQSVLVLPLESA